MSSWTVAAGLKGESVEVVAALGLGDGVFACEDWAAGAWAKAAKAAVTRRKKMGRFKVVSFYGSLKLA